MPVINPVFDAINNAEHELFWSIALTTEPFPQNRSMVEADIVDPTVAGYRRPFFKKLSELFPERRIIPNSAAQGWSPAVSWHNNSGQDVRIRGVVVLRPSLLGNEPAKIFLMIPCDRLWKAGTTISGRLTTTSCLYRWDI